MKKIIFFLITPLFVFAQEAVINHWDQEQYISFLQNDELEFVPSGAPMSREEVRTSRGVQNIQQAGTGIGYQQIGNDNTIT